MLCATASLALGYSSEMLTATRLLGYGCSGVQMLDRKGHDLGACQDRMSRSMSLDLVAV